MADRKKWSDVKALLDDPSVPAAQKSALISSWLRENPPPPPFLADQEPDEIKQKRQEAGKYAEAYSANPLFAGQSVDEAYDKAKKSGDQNSYNEDQEKKAVDDGKAKLDATRPPAATGDGAGASGTKTSDEIFDAAAPALKLFETFGSLLAKIPADCRGNTRALDLDNDIRKPFDEQRGISFADFVADAAHFKRGAETVDRTVQDTGSQLGTLYRTWSGAGADAASDTYNDKIQPKATKLSQTLSTASEATLSTVTTVFQLCKGKADAVVGMYTDLVGKADYTMAQKVVAVANGEHGNEQDLAQIAGWMDLNFGTNLVKTLNDQGCCDGDEIKKHGQDLAKQWVQNQFNPDMWDRLYQGFAKTCKDTKDLVDQAYDALDKVMGGIRNEFEGVSLPGGSGTGGAGTGGGSGAAGGSGGGPGAPGGSGSGSGSGSGGSGSGGSGSGGSGSGGSGGGSGSGSGSGGSGSGGSGAGGGGGPVPSIPDTGSGSGVPGGGAGSGGGSGTDLPSGAGSGSGSGSGGGSGSGSGAGGGGPVPPIPDGSTPSGGGSTGGGSGSPAGQDDGAAAAAAKQQAAEAAEAAKKQAADALSQFSGPGIQTESGAGSGSAGSGSGGADSGGGAGPGSGDTTPSSVPPPSGDGQDAAAAAAEAAKKKAADALKEFSGPGIETESGAGAGGLGGGSGSGDDGKAAAEQAAEEAKKKAADALKEFSGPGIETEPDSLLGDNRKNTGDDDPDVLKVKQGDKTFEMTEPDHDGKMDIKVGDGPGDPKDFKLDWSDDGQPGDGPQGTDTDTYRPGPDGKIHIRDGDLEITAEQPDGPDGPTVVTVDDGQGTPTTYTLGDEDKDEDKGEDKPDSALGDTPAKKLDDLPTHRGTLEDLKPHDGGGSGDPGSHGGGDGSHHGGGAGDPGSHGGGGGPSAAGIGGGSHGGSGVSGAGFDPGSGGLGETPMSGGAHTGAGAAQPQPAAAFASAGGAAGAPSSSMSGMPAMGAMGGAQGGGGGDTERRSSAYRIEGAVFDNLGEPGRRIIGSLNDDEDPPSARTW
ncbi:WXG100 family type VII secretion target [Amycolatopsis sp. NPDC051045]|uniref:WXG100 family type VII secretion target n=1 Tax=Amycolatopsis sp. NPDC051045 TaxID=3156922 RepID=UPI00342E4F82